MFDCISRRTNWLDVYKRQLQIPTIHEGADARKIEQKFLAGQEIKGSWKVAENQIIKPVSYTHLSLIYCMGLNVIYCFGNTAKRKDCCMTAEKCNL